MTDSEWEAFKSKDDLSRIGLTQPAEWYTTRTTGDWQQGLDIDSYNAALCVAAVLGLVTPEWK